MAPLKTFLDIKVGNSPSERIDFELFRDESIAVNVVNIFKNDGLKTAKVSNIIPGENLEISSFHAHGQVVVKKSVFKKRHVSAGLLSVHVGEEISILSITLGKCPQLDDKWIVVGRVVGGMDELKKIEKIPRDASDKLRVTVHVTGSGLVGWTDKIEPLEEPVFDEKFVASAGSSPLEARLLAARLKMNQSRRLNSAAITEKSQKIHAVERYEEADHILLEPAFIAQNVAKKKLKESIDFTDPEVAMYRAHEKRIAMLPTSAENYLTHSEFSEVSQEAKQRVADMVLSGQQKRREFSRRRLVRDDQDITHISEKNRVYNSMLQKAFGKSFSGIKTALERGSAI